MQTDLRTRVSGAVEFLKGRLPEPPRCGIILGTGLGPLTQELQETITIPYSEVPGLPLSTAPGHSGNLIFGKIGAVAVLAFEGRFHLYEGYSTDDITLPVRVLGRLGVESLVLTNACGGMNLDFGLGDLMIIDDHISLIGVNPLTGPNHDDWGPRFPDMSAPYDSEYANRLEAIGRDQKLPIRRGVYVAVPGPNLETRAEYRMLRMLGADVVGMSTVPEVIVAVHEGLRTAAISVITDMCDPNNLEPVSVETILSVAAEAEPKLTRLVKEFIQSL